MNLITQMYQGADGVFNWLDGQISPHKTFSRFGKQFTINEMKNTVDEVIDSYKLFDMRPTDIVLDIGAGIGGFSLMVCDKCKHVYAVEPLYGNEVLHNAHINNNDDDITVLHTCLGNEYMKNIRFLYRSKKVYCDHLHELIDKCGGHVNFIKCDCEGCEWYIKPHELRDIRRIEMEYHILKNSNKRLSDITDMLYTEGFDYFIDNIDKAPSDWSMSEVGIIHAWKKQ